MGYKKMQPEVKPAPVRRTKRDLAQAESIERVSEKMAPVIIDWFNAVGVGHEFTLYDITLHVMKKMVCSPTSPYRVMAHLRKMGQVNYRVLSRKASSYVTIAVVDDDDFFADAS